MQMHVTPRQSEILALIASGFSDRQIGKRLGVSPRTIESHLQRLYQQNGIHKRAEAVAAWLRTPRTPDIQPPSNPRSRSGRA